MGAVPSFTKAPRPINIPPVQRESAAAAQLQAGAERDRQTFSHANLSECDLTGSSFSECEFVALTLTATQFRGARFTEIIFTTPFAPSFLAARSTWRDVLFDNPRIGSAEMFEADASALHIRGGKIDYLNLRNSRLTDVVIEDCNITDLDLGGCRGTRIALINCRIGALDLTRAALVDVDLRSSAFGAIIGLEGLRGTTIDDSQLSALAPLLAVHLGIRVE